MKFRKAEWPNDRKEHGDHTELRAQLLKMQIGEVIAVPCEDEYAAKPMRSIVSYMKNRHGLSFTTRYLNQELFIRRDPDQEIE